MSTNPVYKKLFESYNRAIQNKCEESLGSVRNFEDFGRLINDARATWEKTEFEGELPSEYFGMLNHKDEIAEVFKLAAVMCDEFIPDSFIKKILKTDSMDIIAEHAFGNCEIDMKNSAVRLLGLSGREEYTEKLMELIYSEGEYSELLKETARQALIDIGEPAISYIEEKISKKDILADDDFHLIIALIGIDSTKKNDSVFTLLKESFRKTTDKALAARCLADYGDGRAVPMLRSYLERNLHKLEENTVFELQGAVLQLGGSSEGLNIPPKP